MATFVQAQYRASIQGVITDPQGAVVPGATVTLTDKETNRTLTATSNDAGVYNFNALPPSRYSLTVEKQGFKKTVLGDIGLIAEQANAINLRLDLGGATDTVTVSAESAPAIDTETANISGTVTAHQIQSLPSFGRDVYQLAQLAPGAFGDASRTAGGDTAQLPGNAGPGGPGASTGIFATENGPQISVGGGRRELNNFQIDGVGISSVSWAGTAVITPNQDSVKEVKIVTNSYDAEDGRYPGGQVKVISQNGTNDFHGSFFFKLDRPGLNAFQRYGGFGKDPVRNESRFNDFGGAVGGPILKNRLFFFFSYETIRNHGTNRTQGWFETPSFLSGAQAGTAAALFANFPGAGPLGTVAGNTNHTCADIGLSEGIQCATVSGGGLDLGRPLTPGFFPLGTADPSWLSKDVPGLGGDGTGSPANLDGIADIQFVNATSPADDIEEQYNGRLDFQATSKDLLAFSIYRVPTSNDSFNGALRPMNLFHHTVINEAETFLWTRTFSPTLLNEVRANAAGWRWKDLQNNPNAPWGLPVTNFCQLNAPTDVNNVCEGFGTAGVNGFGIGAPGLFDQWTYAVKDVLTKVHGSHTIKLGGEVTRLLFVDTAPWNARPTYFFHNMWDFLNDAPGEEQATFDPLTGVPTDFRKDTRSNLFGFFVQDDFKVRPNLTLNLGLRWEYNGPISEKNNNIGIVVLGGGTSLLTGMRVRKGGNLYNVPKTDFGPQVGFAWSPMRYNGKVVFRGGFGIGYSGLEEAISLNGRSNPPFLSPAFNLIGNQVVYGVNTFPANVNSFGGYAPNPFGTATFDPNTNLPVPGGQNFAAIDVTGYPQDWPDTRTYRYSLETQYDLGNQWVATLGYQGTNSRHLTRQYNLNVFALAHNIPVNPVVQHVDFYDNEGFSNFSAFLGGIRHSFSRSFQFEAQYRWAKAMDSGSNNFANGNYQFTLNEDYGPSDYDVAHSFKLFGIYSPTIFRGEHGWLEKIVGGWTISGILNAHSGFPYNPVYNIACDALYLGSCGGGGASGVRPALYNGRASDDHSTDVFKQANGAFPGGGNNYFTPPTVAAGPDFATVAADPLLRGPIPGMPGIGRNAFRGPRYFDVDATLSKAFGLPKMPVLGENAKIELRANFFNLFNKANLFNIQTDVNDAHFGTAQEALAGRTIEVQGRFSF
jgi:hypothetical protein